jgi:hypothetical protein
MRIFAAAAVFAAALIARGTADDSYDADHPFDGLDNEWENATSADIWTQGYVADA